MGVERKRTYRRRVENNFYQIKIKGQSGPARQAILMGRDIAANYLRAIWYAVLRGQEQYIGSVKEQENQDRNVKPKERESLREKLESSNILFWGGWMP